MLKKSNAMPLHELQSFIRTRFRTPINRDWLYEKKYDSLKCRAGSNLQIDAKLPTLTR